MCAKKPSSSFSYNFEALCPFQAGGLASFSIKVLAGIARAAMWLDVVSLLVSGSVLAAARVSFANNFL